MFAFKIIFIFLSIIFSVQSWYTCDQLTFCNKIRNSEGQDRFVINEASGFVGRSTYEADLTNTEDNTQLKLTFTSLEDNTFRLFINDPNKPRHTIPEALNGEPTQVPFDSVSTGDGVIKFIVGPNHVEISTNPFNVIVRRDDNTVIALNKNSKMTFNSGDDEAIAMDLWITGSKAYGIPEHADHLALKTTGPGGLDPYRLFNVDYAAYNVESRESVYGAVPVLYGHGSNGSAGIFWLNSAQSFIDINTDVGVNSLFISESGAIDLFFFTGPTLQDSVKQYCKLTGTAPIPQYFALGFHQSRYSYETQEDLQGVVAGFDEYDFPIDVVWLDIDYTDNIKYFTWNLESFPDPLGMQETLESTGRKLVVIIDPHIKVEVGYSVYDQGIAQGFFVNRTDGSVYEAKCWPGISSYIDFTNPDARAWYSSLYSLENFPMTTVNTHIWNDMNEPAVFESEENTMPLTGTVHHNGWLHRDVHNTFGFFQTMGTYAGLLARSDNKLRPFILTRSHFSGSQRYAAMWTGDNVADWRYLRISVPMCLTEALAGISFCGADVGGFLNNVEDELFQRWYQVGAWLPFYRSHSTKGTNRREPYLYPEEIQGRLRNALRQRYVHLPYWYTLWWEHSTTAVPVIRPLAYHYLEEVVYDIDQEWLVGSDILVSPVMEQGLSQINIYLPGDDQQWFNIDLDTISNGGQTISLQVDMDTVPVFYRSGSIIPRKETIRPSTVQTHDDQYTLHVFLDTNNYAAGNLYVDDYESFNYKNKEYLYVKYEYKDSTLQMEKIDEDADYNGAASVGDVIIHGQSKLKQNVYLLTNGERKLLQTSYDAEKFILIVSHLNLDVKQPFKIEFV